MQGELFGGTTTTEAPRITVPQAGWMDRFRITLRLDHLSIVGILALVLYVLIFSFGVEKGKRFAIEEMKALKAKQEQINRELNLQEPSEPPILKSVTARQTQTSLAGSVPQEKTKASQPTMSPEPSHVTLTGKYTIQLITFTSRSKAEKEVERLKQKGFQSFIIPAGKFFQVCVNAFETTGEAKQKLGELKSEGFASPDAYIRPFKGAITP